jgi:hypothetical protein
MLQRSENDANSNTQRAQTEQNKKRKNHNGSSAFLQ